MTENGSQNDAPTVQVNLTPEEAFHIMAEQVSEIGYDPSALTMAYIHKDENTRQ